MTLPTGAISFNNINVELGRSGTAEFSINDTTGRKLASAGSTGQSITAGTVANINNYQGHARATSSVTGSPYNINVLTLVAGNYATGKTWSTVTVDAGTVVGSTSTGAYAFTANGNTGDIIDLVNNGTIVGAGGNGGTRSGGAGAAGGPALNASYPVSVTNNGAIWGGGGGGGAGNDGGDGSKYPAFVGGGGGGGGAGQTAGAGGANGGSAGTLTTGGGRGAPGGTAGAGGVGGGPGLAGAGGANGSAPGAAGYYVSSNGNVTWVANGDRRGQVG